MFTAGCYGLCRVSTRCLLVSLFEKKSIETPKRQHLIVNAMSPSIKHRNLLSVTPLQHPLTQCGPKTLHMFNISLPKSLTYLLLISYSLRILVKIKHVRYFNISTNIIFSGASIDVLTINDISGHSHKTARICILPTRKGHSHKSARLCIFNKERASTQVS